MLMVLSKCDWLAFDLVCPAELDQSVKRPPLWLVRRIAMECIADNTIMCFLARQTKARIVGWSVHDEREGDSLPTLAAIVCTHPNIMMRVGSAALIDLIQNRSRVLDGNSSFHS